MKLPHHLIEGIVDTLIDVIAQGRYADRCIEYRFKTHPKWGARDRKLFAESVYENVRWWRWHWNLAGLPDAECQDAERITPARVWLVWTAWWWKQHGDVPPLAECAAFDIVEAKRLQKECRDPAIRASVPDWLYGLGSQSLGETWPSIMEALNHPADVFLRANTLKVTAAELRERLIEEGIQAEAVAKLPDALRLAERKNVFTSPSFREGLFEVQDAASQWVAPFLQAEPGMRVVDACAGAGGKALHIASLMQNKGQIIALDVHQWKLDELRRRARRNGAHNIEARFIEDRQTIKRLLGKADRVLLDVPCSGLGVLRRNPDAKWKLSEEEIARLTELQQTILADYSRMVKPGGKLVYATCSILPRENENQVRLFLEQNAGTWNLEEEITLRPDRDGFDGFYAARMARAE